MVAIAPRDEYVDRLKDLGCEYVELPMKVSGINPLSDLLLLLRCWRKLRTADLDVLLTYTIKPNIYGAIACRMLGIPIICNVSGLGTVFIKHTIISTIAIWLYRISVGQSEHVFFQNDEDQTLFMSRVKIRGNTSLLKGSGVDLTQFQPRHYNNAHPVFLMIGRPMIEKGIYEFAGSAEIVLQRFPECQFQLIGRWDTNDKRSVSRDQMEEWQEKGILEYLGTSDHIQEMIARADAIVLPSYREGTPRTLLEGGAMGKILITTDVPGCHHVVKDGHNGFLANVRSKQSLAEAIFRYLQLEPIEKEAMQKKSREYIEEHFDEKLVIAAYKRVIQQLSGNAES